MNIRTAATDGMATQLKVTHGDTSVHTAIGVRKHTKTASQTIRKIQPVRGLDR